MTISVTANFFTYRKAILRSELPPTTKHVLLTLSCYVNDVGEGCYPSTKRLAEDTSLSERSVITHLHAAQAAGWIKIQEHGYGGRNWRRHEYVIQFPRGWQPVNRGAERGSVPNQQGAEPNDAGVLKEVQSITPEEEARLKPPTQTRAGVSPIHRDGDLIPCPQPAIEPTSDTTAALAMSGIRSIPEHLPATFSAHHLDSPPMTAVGWQGRFRKWVISEVKVYAPSRKAMAQGSQKAGRHQNLAATDFSQEATGDGRI